MTCLLLLVVVVFFFLVDLHFKNNSHSERVYLFGLVPFGRQTKAHHLHHAVEEDQAIMRG